MKLPGDITILMSEEGASLQINDRLSREMLLCVEIEPKDFTALMGRMASIHVDLDLTDKLQRVGKYMEWKTFTFLMPEGVEYGPKRQALAWKALQEQCPEGWTPSDSFNSQDSFFHKEDQFWARGHIRRWVDVDDGVCPECGIEKAWRGKGADHKLGGMECWDYARENPKVADWVDKT